MAPSLRSLSFGALARRSGVPDWPADVMASVIGDRVTETARGNRLASIIVPTILTVAALIGAFLVDPGVWRTLLFVVAGLGVLVVLVFWLLGTASVKATEAFLHQPGHRSRGDRRSAPRIRPAPRRPARPAAVRGRAAQTRGGGRADESGARHRGGLGRRAGRDADPGCRPAPIPRRRRPPPPVLSG